MLIFLKSVYEKYKILPDEDNILKVNDDILIFVSEQDNETVLICPCFSIPTEQGDLVELLSMNCNNNIIFFHMEGLILAKLSFQADDNHETIIEKFDFYLTEIARAVNYFVHRRC